MITTLGELTFEQQIPLLAAFKSGLDVSVGVSIPDIEAKLAGLNQVLLSITVAPPDLSGTIDAALQTVTQLQAAIGGPSVTLEAEAIATAIAELEAQLDLIMSASGLTIPSGALSVYVYDGSSSTIGAELQSAVNASLPGAPGHANALILVTTSPADWSAASEVFKTS